MAVIGLMLFARSVDIGELRSEIGLLVLANITLLLAFLTPIAFVWTAIGEISVKGFYQWLSLIPLAVMGVIWLCILIAVVLDRYPAMSRYRRPKIEGGIFFFTVVLADRSSELLVEHIEYLRQVCHTVQGACHYRPTGAAIWPR
jgi:hypothetical protein